MIKSSGDLQNDSGTAEAIRRILAQLAAADRGRGEDAENARVSLHYRDHCLVVTRNNANINICKLPREPPAVKEAELPGEEEQEKSVQ